MDCTICMNMAMGLFRGPTETSADVAQHSNLRSNGGPDMTVQTTQEAKFGNLIVRYAYLSQIGSTDDGRTPVNEDCVATEVDPRGGLLGVLLDGHCHDGKACAEFCCESLIKYFTQWRKHYDKNTPTDLQLCLRRAFVHSHKALQQHASIDDSLSGTTAISMHISEEICIIANAGDCRAVLGKLGSNSSSLEACPLSWDHTFFREDEYARVLNHGEPCRIMSWDQMEGFEPPDENEEGADPLCVWSTRGDYPGTRWTRSLGDTLAHELGVTEDPEMTVKCLAKEDRVIVLASDGVFEFLTNQSVIDIASKFRDPLDACRAIATEAYELWRQFEKTRVDDLTVLVCYLDHTGNDSDDGARSEN